MLAPNNRRLLMPSCDNPRPCIDPPDDGFGHTGMQEGHAIFRTRGLDPLVRPLH
jgi:hypothetical protein